MISIDPKSRILEGFERGWPPVILSDVRSFRVSPSINQDVKLHASSIAVCFDVMDSPYDPVDLIVKELPKIARVTAIASLWVLVAVASHFLLVVVGASPSVQFTSAGLCLVTISIALFDLISNLNGIRYIELLCFHLRSIQIQYQLFKIETGSDISLHDYMVFHAPMPISKSQ